MSVILITFQGKPERLSVLHAIIEKLCTDWWRHVKNTWLVVTESGVDNFATILSVLVEKEEILLVAEINILHANGLLPTEGWYWINKHTEKNDIQS